MCGGCLLLLLASSADLGFLLSADFLLAVLQLLALFARSTNLILQTSPDETVLGLNIEGILKRVIDETKTSACFFFFFSQQNSVVPKFKSSSH
jgi:hypothetical protein